MAVGLIGTVGGLVTYDQLNTAGGTRVSKIGVRQIVAQAETLKRQSDLQQTIGERIQIARADAPEVNAFLYRPTRQETDQKLPVFIYAHGGAWIGLDATDMDEFSQDIADRTPALVVNVNYRLLQTEPFPYQQTEIVDTVKWVRDNAAILNIDPDNIVISGGSAGGHIAAGAAMMLNRERVNLRASVLEVPFLDFVNDDDNDMGMFDGFVEQLLETFSPDADPIDPVISPVRADTDTLSGLDDTYFIVGLQDPLYKQALRYKERLEASGVNTNLKAFDTNHGYTLEKTDVDGRTVSVSDRPNARAADEYRVSLLQHIFFDAPLPE